MSKKRQKRWAGEYDEALRERLAVAHQSLKKANDLSGGLMNTIAELNKRIEERDRVIDALRAVIFEYQQESIADSHLSEIAGGAE